MPVFQYNVFWGFLVCVCFTKIDDALNLLTSVLMYILDDTAYV